MEKNNKRITFLGVCLFLVAAFIPLGLLGSFLCSFIKPSILWIPGIFGLAFPLLVVGALVFGLIYLFFLRRRCLIFFFAILLNVGNISHFIHFAPKANLEEREQQNSLKILSYNVCLLDYYQYINPVRGKTKNDILKFLSEQNSDIICLQEYYESKDLRFLVSPILKKNGYIYHTQAEANKKFYYGNIIFSKYPIIKEGSLEGLSKFDIVFADLLIQNDTLRVYNMHLASNRFDKKDQTFYQKITTSPTHKDLKYRQGLKKIIGKLGNASIKREKQVEKIENHLSLSPYPTFLCGDMNENPVSYSYHRFGSLLEDAFCEKGRGLGQTYKGIFPSYRIDYIFYKGPFCPLWFKTFYVNYADHRPIAAAFSWTKNKKKLH